MCVWVRACVCACECAGEKQGFCKIHLGGFFILILNQSKAASLTNWNLKCVFLFPIILSCILVSARPVGVEVQFVFRCECPSTLVGGCEHYTDSTTNQMGMSPCRVRQLGVLLVFSLTLNYFNMKRTK